MEVSLEEVESFEEMEDVQEDNWDMEESNRIDGEGEIVE